MSENVEDIRRSIRGLLNELPGCSSSVSYPIAHRISAVLSGTEAELAINVYGEDIEKLRTVVAKMKTRLNGMSEVADVRANREVTLRTMKISYNLESLAEAGLTLREAGEQVSAAFNGIEVGDVRDGLKQRAVTIRIEGFDEDLKPIDIGSFLLTSRSGRRVRLDDVARIFPEDASDLMLRENGRRKALISLNPAEGIDTGSLVAKLKSILDPIAFDEGMSVEYGGSYQARESAAKRLGVLAIILLGAIFIVLVFALKSSLAAFIALLNAPLALIGGVAAVRLADPVLSVSSLVGFITVIGFVLRNGILLLQRYRELIESGHDVKNAIREGSLERMSPILMTSLTTVLGLIPIMLAGNKPGGELLSPLAIVQFGGILGAGALNLVILPAAALVASKGLGWNKVTSLSALLIFSSLLIGGCKSYEPKPLNWEEESNTWLENRTLTFSSLDDVANIALIGNAKLNKLRIESAAAENVAKESGWWEDPELDTDIMRIVNPADHPYLGGASLSFSIPLSGALKLDEKSARAYSDAAKEEILAAEKDVVANAKIAAVRFVYAKRIAETIIKFDDEKRIKDAFDGAEKLTSVGELQTTELASAKRRRHERTHKLRQAENEADEAESLLRKLLGVSPKAKIVFKNDLATQCPHTSMPPEINPLRYTQHPEVRALAYRLEGGEAALEAEIRRQYPDLKLGPAYSNEEGLDRFGLVAGITLPLWNRNRKGIAEAEGVRNSAYIDAVNKWKEIVADVHNARRKLKRLLDHRAENPSRNVDEANALSDAGEINPLEFLSIREEILETHLSELEWKAEICTVSEELEKNNVEE
jgi:outer membrane protein TolC